ncbi:hypothetical protein LINPERPRIM_LOCUS30243 [Linum perenne]
MSPLMPLAIYGSASTLPPPPLPLSRSSFFSTVEALPSSAPPASATTSSAADSPGLSRRSLSPSTTVSLRSTDSPASTKTDSRSSDSSTEPPRYCLPMPT